MIRLPRKKKKLLLLPVLLLAFLLPFYLTSSTAGAVVTPKRSECNTTSDPQKCKDDFDKCRSEPDRVKKDKCRLNAIEKNRYQCGNLPSDGDNVKTKFNLGCLGEKAPVGTGPIQDMLFSLIRFASAGIGIVIVLSIILAGIQYTMAEGSPEKTQKAKMRILHASIGLVIYIFAFAILQFLIPGGIFR